MDWGKSRWREAIAAGRESVGDLGVLVTCGNPGRVMDRLASYESTKQIIARGDTKMSIRWVLTPGGCGSSGKRLSRSNSKTKGIAIRRSIELDILEDGSLDLPESVLKDADWVVASIHYGQNQPRDRITRRLIKAIQPGG